ncbi:MAG: 30S ribosomal protein S15 [Bacteroidota bacterium]
MQIISSTFPTLFKQHSPRQSDKDTGSPESQIALFTARVQHITQHLKTHKKDHKSRLGLIKLVQKRKKQLLYLSRVDINRYRLICDSLAIKKKIDKNK